METPGKMTKILSFQCSQAFLELLDQMVDKKQREDSMRRIFRSEVIRQACIAEMHACGILGDDGK